MLVQPDNYIKYSNTPLPSNKTKVSKEQISKIQELALKMKDKGFSEEQIIESFFHEYRGKIEVARELEKAGFKLDNITNFFRHYDGSLNSLGRKLTKDEYSQHLIEQDIKRFAIFSKKDKAKIREMESRKVPISKIKELYPNYKPNDEIKAIELGNTGKSLREVKKIFPNYEPKK